MWRGRLDVALDALATASDSERLPVQRRGPMEATTVQLPTGDRLLIPTGAETLRLKSYLLMCRNSTRTTRSSRGWWILWKPTPRLQS